MTLVSPKFSLTKTVFITKTSLCFLMHDDESFSLFYFSTTAAVTVRSAVRRLREMQET